MVTGRDMAMRHFYESKELEAMIACRAESNALALPIKIVKAEYSFDGQTLTFMFSSGTSRFPSKAYLPTISCIILTPASREVHLRIESVDWAIQTRQCRPPFAHDQ